MYNLTIKEHFSSAHFLRDYEGKCKNLHGHNWKVEAVVSGKELDKVGMIADFGVLKVGLKKVLEGLDHACLNEIEYFKEVNPTSENIAKFLYQEYQKEIEPLTLESISIWESDNSCVRYVQ